MKSKFIIIVLLFQLISFVSCKKYLEPTTYSITTTDSYYKSASDAETALTGVYSMLLNTNTFGQDLTEFMYLGSTDEAGVNSASVDRTPFGNCGVDPTNVMLNNVWNRFFAGINRANYLLENIGNIKNFTGNRAIQMQAEARLLRAVYHFYLAESFGAIPTYTTSAQDASKARQPLSEVYPLIIDDLTFAYNNLPNRNTIAGRVNKWTAGGFLARVYTYLASAKTNNVPDFGKQFNSFDWVNAQDLYTKAKTLTTSIIDSSGYILISDFSKLFRESTKTDQYQECMFVVESSTNPSLNTWVTIINCLAPPGNRDVNGGSSGQFRPLAELYYKFNNADFRFKHSLTASYRNTGTPFETVGGVKYYIPDTVTVPSAATYAMGKFRQVDPTLKTGLPNYVSYLSFPLLRFADIILLHAEALYFTGDEIGARADLTKVRQRAVKSGYTVADLNTAYRKTNFVDELLDERSRELCFECIRRFDLARFNKYDQVIRGLSSSASYGFYNKVVTTMQTNWKPERIWWPIPQSQLDLNPNLVQNAGY